jgi:NAD kinase
VVVVTRATELELLIARHGTRSQAEFFLKTRGQSIDAVAKRHATFESALTTTMNAIPVQWRRNRIDRGDLDRFLFEPDDVVVALGQDGLVANVAKYLAGQPVIGLNPAPDLYEGVLVRHQPEDAPKLMQAAAMQQAACESRTMVEAILDDGQRLVALNEIFVGHRSHQSARYHIDWNGARERHSSSGVITATGTGATGWARSIHHERSSRLPLPAPTSGELTFFVREAWPSVASGTSITESIVAEGRALAITSEMDEGGVIFGDGIEGDRLEFSWGRRVELRAAKTRLRLLTS